MHLFRIAQSLKRLKHFLFHRGGHGVHSHFAYLLIRDVIEEKHPYYCFSSLRYNNPFTKLDSNTLDCIGSNLHLELIFRLCNFVQCSEAFVLGPKNSVVSNYIKASSKEIKLHHIPAASPMCVENQDSIQSLIIVVESPRMLDKLETCLSQLPPTEFLTILLKKNWKEAMELKKWEAIKSKWPATMLIDLVELEMLFYSPKLNKKAYKAFI